MKDVLLVGFGAIGTIFSFVLKKTGKARLTVVARSNYAAIKSQGMTIHSTIYGHIQGWRPDRLCRSVAEAADQPYSHVFIATKMIPELTKTSDILSPMLNAPYSDKYPQPIYVVLQNGLNVERDLYLAIEALGKDEPRIVGTTVRIGANLRAPNEVVHDFLYTLSMGVYRLDDTTTSRNTPEETFVLQEVADLLSAGGNDIKIVPQIQWAKFAKNIWNIAFSSVTTLSRHPLQAFCRPPPTQETTLYEPYLYPATADKISTYTLSNIKALMLEMVALGRGMGIPDAEDGILSNHVDTLLESTISLHQRAESVHKPSMMLDMENGLPMEVEPIFGEVVRLAKRYQVDIPRTEMVYALLLVIQNQILRT